MRHCWCSANPKRGLESGGVRASAKLFFYNMVRLYQWAKLRGQAGRAGRFADVLVQRIVDQSVMQSLHHPLIRAGVD